MIFFSVLVWEGSLSEACYDGGGSNFWLKHFLNDGRPQLAQRRCNAIILFAMIFVVCVGVDHGTAHRLAHSFFLSFFLWAGEMQAPRSGSLR